MMGYVKNNKSITDNEMSRFPLVLHPKILKNIVKTIRRVKSFVPWYTIFFLQTVNICAFVHVSSDEIILVIQLQACKAHCLTININEYAHKLYNRLDHVFYNKLAKMYIFIPIKPSKKCLVVISSSLEILVDIHIYHLKLKAIYHQIFISDNPPSPTHPLNK